VGPIAVTMPIFDSGVRSARVAVEQARYDAAGAAYLARLREAVREVEAALVRLQSSAARRDSLRVAAIGFQGSFAAAEARYRAGVSSLFELEDARRSMVAANSALIDEHREAVAAWIALYRAIGGGWSPPEPTNAVSGLSGGTTLQAESRRLPPAGRHRLE
jgi:outer membrane protein TolC